MKIRPLILAACLAGASVGMTGCNCYQVLDEFDYCTMGLRNQCQAKRAWHRRSDCYDNVPHEHHFRKGFIDGYVTVAKGGGQCPPTLPPRCYWGVCYQSAEGRQKVNAWFDGHTHGRLAAEQDGVSDLGRIPFRNICGPNCPPPAVGPVMPYPNPMLPGPVPGAPIVPPEPADEMSEEMPFEEPDLDVEPELYPLVPPTNPAPLIPEPPVLDGLAPQEIAPEPAPEPAPETAPPAEELEEFLENALDAEGIQEMSYESAFQPPRDITSPDIQSAAFVQEQPAFGSPISGWQQTRPAATAADEAGFMPPIPIGSPAGNQPDPIWVSR